MSEIKYVYVKADASNKYSNPAPLGLAAFGMTTFLLNCHNAGIWDGWDSMILAVGLVFGGFAQVLAGLMEFLKNNTFGTTAFTGYGCFWLVLCCGIFLQNIMAVPPLQPLALFMFLMGWGIFTLFCVFAQFAAPKLHLIQVIFVLLDILFFVLAIGNLCTHYEWTVTATVLIRIGGIEGIVLGFLALYLAGADIINDTFGSAIFPVFLPVFGKKKKKEEGGETKKEVEEGGTTSEEEKGEEDSVDLNTTDDDDTDDSDINVEDLLQD